MKTVICLWGLAHIGKSSAIGRLYSDLNFAMQPPLHVSGDDFCAIADFCGCKVGIASQGDPGSFQEAWLDELFAASCEVIVCASRTKGRTVSAVDQRARTNGYVLIWLSPFSSDGPIRTETLNELTADAVIALIRKSLTY